ncbi:MAG TPA: carboxypeptidase-like regulatory domain-containing protein [Acidobacteriaceae bacterium]|jgi:5-hydroxyisourate hydrolase-like protein (transthyretin family)|nr:carboxypeptidase-like regulatory domain-containing protein [Acidobacteriaceae bacterium]
MGRILLRRWLPVLVAVVAVALAAHAQEQGRGRKYKPPPPTCKVTVTVLKGWNGKPLENASVIFHPLENGKDRGNMELKTNEDGKVTIDVIPVGDQLRLQVLATGYQTYGNDYDLPVDTKEIEVKMSRPQKQYSIYEKHPDQDGQGNGKPQQEQKPPQR